MTHAEIFQVIAVTGLILLVVLLLRELVKTRSKLDAATTLRKANYDDATELRRLLSENRAECSKLYQENIALKFAKEVAEKQAGIKSFATAAEAEADFQQQARKGL